MNLAKRIEVMKALMAVAWADDRMTKRELDELDACARELGLDPVRYEMMRTELRDGVPVLVSDARLEGVISSRDRAELLALARIVAAADGRVDAVESEIIKRIESATGGGS